MIITHTIEAKLRKRLANTTGGIKAAAALGGISERTAHNIFIRKQTSQKTYEAFCSGLTKLEEHEAEQADFNEKMAAGGQLQYA